MSLFAKKDVKGNAVENVQPKRTFGPTHKKKNTYVVKLNNIMADLSLFSECPCTPISVITLNGAPQQKEGDWMRGTTFPNPGATQMVYAFDKLKPVMSEKLRSTIVEYLDKATGEPVLTLFPQNHMHFHKLNKFAVAHIENVDEGKCLFMSNLNEADLSEVSRLNHASRQDLFAQVEMRQNCIKQYKQQCISK